MSGRWLAVVKVLGNIFRWILAVAILLALWQYVLLGHISHVVFAAPSATYSQLETWARDGTLGGMLEATVSEAATGFAIGVVVGLLVGLVIGAGPALVGRVIEPVVSGLYAMPKLVLAPILFVSLGAGFASRVFIVAISVFPVVTIYTVSGIRTVDPSTVRALQLFGATRSQLASKLFLRHTIGYVVTALLFSVVHAITVAIGAEILFGASSGIGGVLSAQQGSFMAQGVLGALVVGTVLSGIALALVRMVGDRLVKAGGSRGSQEAGGARLGF